MSKFDLEERLIDFAVLSINVSSSLPNTVTGRNLSGQLNRSGTSPALNYGEAQSAESRKDFIHKMKVILKELRETHICFRIIKKANLTIENRLIEETLSECNELISIFVSSIKTAELKSPRSK